MYGRGAPTYRGRCESGAEPGCPANGAPLRQVGPARARRHCARDSIPGSLAQFFEDVPTERDHDASEAAFRTKIKHPLRRLGYKPREGGGGPTQRSTTVDLILDRAREIYRLWPDIHPADLPI